MEQAPDDRLRNALKRPYPHGEGTNWDALVTSFASEFDELESTRAEIIAQKVVTDADGRQLDKVGGLVQAPRRTGESDPHYRGRLQVQLRRFTGGGTIQNIKETAAILLGADTSAVSIEEDFDVEAARFTISVWESDLESAGISDTEFLSFVDLVRGAGINTISQTRGSFTYRSSDDYSNGINDAQKGYDNGTYAGLIQ